MNWVLLALTVGAAYAAYMYWGVDNFRPDMVSNQRVLLTGASSGIGEQMAYHFCRMGARVVISARRAAVLEKVIKRCREVGNPDGDYSYVTADMSKMEDTKMLVEKASEKLGGLDFLMLNHVMDLAFDSWMGTESNLTGFDQTLDINVRANMRLASYAMPILKKSAGRIVVTGAGWGKVAPPYALAYTASKFALEGIFTGLRQEFQLLNIPISVTVCTIGLVGTDMAFDKAGDVIAQGSAFPPASPTDTALVIIKAGATRTKEVYFPTIPMWPLCTFRDFLGPTGILDWHWSRIMRPITMRRSVVN